MFRNSPNDRDHSRSLVQSIVADLSDSVGPTSDTPIELVIKLSGENIPTREFAAYLALIDRLYGRLGFDGLQSYAQKKSGRLLIADIRKGSLEIVFRLLPQGAPELVIAALICLFLRSLPNMFKLTSEGAKNLAESYKTLEEGRLLGHERKVVEKKAAEGEALEKRPKQTELRAEQVAILRDAIRKEPTLSKLDPKEQTYVVMILEDLAHAENHNLPATMRFARLQVQDVVLIKGDSTRRE
jgi:hypothetical protein